MGGFTLYGLQFIIEKVLPEDFDIENECFCLGFISQVSAEVEMLFKNRTSISKRVYRITQCK